MNKHIIASSLAAGLLLASGIASAEDKTGWSPDVSVTGTSDYIFRGVSQTDSGPALQFNLGVSHSSGFHAGIWTSNVDFNNPGSGTNLEVDYTAGWAFTLPADTSLDVYLTRYSYPGTNAGYDIAYNELIADYSFLEHYTATIAYSNDYVNTGTKSFYYKVAAEYPIGESGWNVAGGVGYSDISDAAGKGYWDYHLGASRSFGDHFSMDVSYYNTSGAPAFLGPNSWHDSRFVLSGTLSY